MFYEPASGHGLPHDPFKAIVAPRPIGWISTVDAHGRVNLAPYSFFNAFGSRPPIVGFSGEGMKHSAANAVATGAFVFNLATRPLAEAMNATSAPFPEGINEFEAAGIETAPSRLVAPPRVAASPAALECRVIDSLEFKDLDGRPTKSAVVFGQVVGVHIDDRFLKDGLFDMLAARVIARCGYMDYAEVRELFAMQRP